MHTNSSTFVGMAKRRAGKTMIIQLTLYRCLENEWNVEKLPVGKGWGGVCGYVLYCDCLQRISHDIHIRNHDYWRIYTTEKQKIINRLIYKKMLKATVPLGHSDICIKGHCIADIANKRLPIKLYYNWRYSHSVLDNFYADN